MRRSTWPCEFRWKVPNSTTNWTLGCAENLSMQVGNVPFHLHAHVVECAPFRLLLEMPFQHQLLCCLDSLPNGTVDDLRP